MTKREEVAQALAAWDGHEFSKLPNGELKWLRTPGHNPARTIDISVPCKERYLDQAQVAIEAIRKPSQDMVDAAYAIGHGMITDQEIEAIWGVMTDTVLLSKDAAVNKTLEN